MVDGYFVLAADTAWEVRLVVSSWSARMSLRNLEHIFGTSCWCYNQVHVSDVDWAVSDAYVVYWRACAGTTLRNVLSNGTGAVGTSTLGIRRSWL